MFARGLTTTVAAVVLSGCTSAQTSVTAPSTADRCEVRATGSATSFTATGGSGTVAVSTARDCTWSVTADASWVSIAGATTGQGEATLPFTVAPNPVPAARSSAIAVGTEKIALSQAAAPCRYSLGRNADTIGSAGGRLSVDVSTLTGCSWTATPSQTWITVASGQSGNANGTVGLSIAANTGARRVGAVNVAGQTYTVSQDAAPVAPPPAPTPVPPPTPTPAPPPAPSPSPTPPAPQPPTPVDVQLEGRVSGLSGRCPDISFVVSGERIAADRSTEYQKGKCGDVKNGQTVKVRGPKSNNVVNAERIEIR